MIPLNLVIIFFTIAFTLPATYKTFVAVLAILYAVYLIKTKRERTTDYLYDPILYFLKYNKSTTLEACDKLEKFYDIKENLEKQQYPFKAENIKTCRLLRKNILNLLNSIALSIHADSPDNLRLKKTIKFYGDSLQNDIYYMVYKNKNKNIDDINFSSGSIDFVGVEPNDPGLNKNLDLF